MKRSNFIFYYISEMRYLCNKISTNWDGSYIAYPTWISNKKVTINPENNDDDKGLHYAIRVALNHEQIQNNLNSITKISPFIDQKSLRQTINQ